MPLKNKDEYNNYMKNYLKKRKEKNNESVDYDPSAGKPVFEMENITKGANIVTEAFKNKDSNTEEDPVLKTIEKYAKYAPLVMQLIDGFRAAAKDFQVSQQGNVVSSNKPQPPIGWLETSPMQKLNYKYSKPDWYAAGLAYDTYLETGQINPAINISHVDSTYNDSRERSRLNAAAQQRQIGSEPQNLSELARKYPQPPLANDSTPAPAAVPKKEEQQTIAKEIEKFETQNTAILTELQIDNAKYIKLGTDYLNSVDIVKFETYINDIDSLVIKAKAFIPLIPVHVKGMILNTPKEDLAEIVKTQCPEKYKWLIEKDKINKLLDLFEKIKTELN